MVAVGLVGSSGRLHIAEDYSDESATNVACVT